MNFAKKNMNPYLTTKVNNVAEEELEQVKSDEDKLRNLTV